ncbi:MAG: pullulanase-associated domain-containing protein, partial [bacterium]
GQVIAHAELKSFTLKIHYHRTDENYTDWDVWAWVADGTGSIGDAPFLFAEEDGEQVATISIPETVKKIGYIVRKNDWSKKDIEANQFIEFPEVESGTLHFYIESGVEDGRKDYSEATLVPTVVKLHYNRPDGDYTNWDVWAWAHEGGALPTSEYEFADEDGEMVATINIPEGVGKIGFLVRMENWAAKDWEENRYLDISDVICGTVHIKVESGVEAFETTYDANVVTGTKVKSAVYRGDKKVEVTFTGEAEEADVKAIVVKGDAGEN